MFNGTNCTACPATEYYDLAKKNCLKAQEVSNSAALNKTGKVYESNNVTLKSLEESIKNMTVPTKACNETTPLYNGTKCTACPEAEYYDLAKKSCFKPKDVSNVEALNKTGKVYESNNVTLKSLEA